MTPDEIKDVRAWYRDRWYDIGRDEMVSNRSPPPCIAEDVAKSVEVNRRYREGMNGIYRAWSRGEQDPPWPSMTNIMRDVHGWNK